VAFTGCILKRPDHEPPYYGRGHAFVLLGRPKEAEADFREALRLRPDDPQARTHLGTVLGEWPEVEAADREALRLRPDDTKAHYNLGVALTNQQKHAEAEAEYRQALRLQPNKPEVRTNLGHALSGQGRNAEAEAEIRGALRLHPDFPEAHIAYSLLGGALGNMGRHAEAEAACREALRLRPDFGQAHSNLVLALGKQGKTVEAARFYAEALATHPKLADYTDCPLRYNAACSAAMAGCGQGQDTAKLDDSERARLRHQALDWLRAEMAAWDRLMEKKPNHARVGAQNELRMWRRDKDFNVVRGAALAKLPEAEQQAWQQLWDDVEQMLKRVTSNDTKDGEKKPHH
jgi:Flp pilus assembly protein TadD